MTSPPVLPPSSTEPRAYWEAKAEPTRKKRAAAITAERERSSSEVEQRDLQGRLERLRRWYDRDPTELDALQRGPSMAWIGGVFESGNSVDGGARLRSTSCPVLLALGEYDFVAPPSAWTDELLPPKVTVEMFSRSGYTPYVEEPDAFVQVVERWLAAI